MAPRILKVQKIDLLSEVWFAFREALIHHYDAPVVADGEDVVSLRVDKLAIFRGLRDCRDILAHRFDCQHHVFCRYSLNVDNQQLGEMLLSDEGYWGMIEYLVDFSFSCLPIPVVIGQRDNPPIPEGFQYEMLLAVESEMGTIHEVSRDFLKLLDVRARAKLLIFRARTSNFRKKEIETALETVMANHANPPNDDEVLMIGIPSYKQFREAANANQQAPYQLYTSANSKLVSRRWNTFDLQHD